MKAFRMSFAIAAIAAFCTFWPGNARAQSPDKKTVLTFSQPVEIPNLVLPAGTYVFKRADSATPNLVQILNADESRVFATLITASDYRRQASDETVITFEERPNGSPKAIKDWFYPGDNSGEEFLYPTQQENSDKLSGR
jgi:hypothetical protein